MPYRELIEWEAFEEEFGPVTVHERLDAAAAIIAHRINGGQGHVSDYLPQWESNRPTAHIADWLSAMSKKR